MNAMVKKITELLNSSDLELRIAAVRVTAELGVRSKPTLEAIGRCLREPHDELRLVALQALARLGASDVTPMVVPLILSTGALRDQAMAVISAVGASVTPQLKQLYAQADFHGKRAVITAISRVGGKDALAFLLKILPDEPFEIQKHVTLCLSEALDRMTPASQLPVLQLVLRLARDKKVAKHPQLLITAAILLGHARGSSLAATARAALRQLANKKSSPEVRRHAIVSWNRLQPEAKPTAADHAFLLDLLTDDDWHSVAQHALHGFERMPFDRKLLPKLADLLRRSPHFSVHIHVFERLQTSDRSEVAKAILPFLSDSRFRVREAAQTALRRMPSSIESLFELLMRTEDLEVTQRVNAILRDFPQETRLKYVHRAVVRLLNLFDSNDPHYKSFLEFVKGVDPEALRKRVYVSAHALKKGRKKDRWDRIAALIQLLWDNHLITPEGRYLLAIAHLRTSSKELSPAARRGNLGLRVLRSLIYDDYDELVKRLIADRDLNAEDYHYLGFHFSEEGDDLRPFSKAMLEHVVKKFPRSSAAAAALHKLELQAQALAEAAVPAARSRSSKKKAAAAGQPAPKDPKAESASARGKAAKVQKPVQGKKPPSAAKTQKPAKSKKPAKAK